MQMFTQRLSQTRGLQYVFNIKRENTKTIFSEGEEDDHLGDLEDGLACCSSPSCPDEGRAGRPASTAAVSTPRCCADLCEIPSAAPSNLQRVCPPPPPPPQQDSGSWPLPPRWCSQLHLELPSFLSPSLWPPRCKVRQWGSVTGRWLVRGRAWDLYILVLKRIKVIFLSMKDPPLFLSLSFSLSLPHCLLRSLK